jgi:hypothetical protein
VIIVHACVRMNRRDERWNSCTTLPPPRLWIRTPLRSQRPHKVQTPFTLNKLRHIITGSIDGSLLIVRVAIANACGGWTRQARALGQRPLTTLPLDVYVMRPPLLHTSRALRVTLSVSVAFQLERAHPIELHASAQVGARVAARAPRPSADHPLS